MLTLLDGFRHQLGRVVQLRKLTLPLLFLGYSHVQQSTFSCDLYDNAGIPTCKTLIGPSYQSIAVDKYRGLAFSHSRQHQNLDHRINGHPAPGIRRITAYIYPESRHKLARTISICCYYLREPTTTGGSCGRLVAERNWRVGCMDSETTGSQG